MNFRRSFATGRPPLFTLAAWLVGLSCSSPEARSGQITPDTVASVGGLVSGSGGLSSDLGGSILGGSFGGVFPAVPSSSPSAGVASGGVHTAGVASSVGGLPAGAKAKPGNTEGRIKAGLVALYEFREGSGDSISDSSGVSPELPLRIQDNDRQEVSWVEGGPGLSLRASNYRENMGNKWSGKLERWESDFKLMLGNEIGPASKPDAEGRAWSGEIYLLAFYNRALSKAEIAQNHLARY